MSVASVQVEPVAELGPDVRLVRLDCPHGSTTAWYQNPPGSGLLDDREVIRYALVRHHQAEGCRCIRRLWRRLFGCAWPEVPLVQGRPG